MTAVSHEALPEAPMVHFDRMTRRYGAVTAAHEVSFDVLRGEMFGLIGPDGAGKTTTLRVALGLLATHGGLVRTCGLDPVRQRDEVSQRVGYLSQRFSLYGDLSVDENIAFFARINGVRGWGERRDELLDRLRMTPFRERLADRLSGGMRQKLALLCTLIHTPEVIILDEPTTGVDPVSRRDFWKILARLQREGLTLLLTTPYLDEAERCQRVALMDRGRILSVSTPDELRSLAEGSVIEVLAEPRRRAAEILGEQSEVADVQVFGERLHATLHSRPASDSGTTAARLGNVLSSRGCKVDSIRAVAPSLEDIFIARVQAAGPTEGTGAGASREVSA